MVNRCASKRFVAKNQIVDRVRMHGMRTHENGNEEVGTTSNATSDPAMKRGCLESGTKVSGSRIFGRTRVQISHRVERTLRWSRGQAILKFIEAAVRLGAVRTL